MIWKFVAWQVLCAWMKPNCWSLTLFALQKCQPHIVQPQTSAINMTSGIVVFKRQLQKLSISRVQCVLWVPKPDLSPQFYYLPSPESPRGPYHGKRGPRRGCFLTETHVTKSTAEKNKHVNYSRDWRRPTSEPPIRWEASRGLQILSFILSEWIPAWKSEGTILLFPAMTNHHSIQ